MNHNPRLIIFDRVRRTCLSESVTESEVSTLSMSESRFLHRRWPFHVQTIVRVPELCFGGHCQDLKMNYYQSYQIDTVEGSELAFFLVWLLIYHYLNWLLTDYKHSSLSNTFNWWCSLFSLLEHFLLSLTNRILLILPDTFDCPEMFIRR